MVLLILECLHVIFRTIFGHFWAGQSKPPRLMQCFTIFLTSLIYKFYHWRKIGTDNKWRYLLCSDLKLMKREGENKDEKEEELQLPNLLNRTVFEENHGLPSYKDNLNLFIELGKLSKSIFKKHMEFSICWLTPPPPLPPP